MKKLPNPIINLKSISSYNYKTDIINSILEKFAIFVEKNMDRFLNAIEKDKLENAQVIDFKEILRIIRTYKIDMPLLPYFTPRNIKDGFGNIGVMYNGNPYITLKLLMNAIRTHNNIVFFTNNFKNLNDLIIESINLCAKEIKYVDRFANLQKNYTTNDFIKMQNCFNMLIYVGNKREYQSVSKKLNIPSIYRGYGYIDIFIEDKSFKETLLDIDDYAYENGIKINYFTGTDINETIEYINKYNLNDCFAVFTQKSEIAYTFLNGIKAKNIFINSNPFKNYEFDLNENQIVYSKNISMKI